jgi:ribosomal protein S18 acetylase RimI-like enzyme
MPDPILNLQELTPVDWLLLRSIRLAALRDSPQAFAARREHEELWTEEDWRETLRSSTWLIARAGLEVVGLTRCIGDERRSWLYHLEAIWVRPTHRRQGVFRALLTDLIERAHRVPVTELRLWVLAENLQAQQVYSRLGFQMTGESGLVPGAPNQVEWRMRLRIKLLPDQ